ncbi:MAG TPA: DUF4978 domain-containing protein [Opitutaceae bacterium]|nr:DUF4978 domain-containing protein [Opitutaceae bacterium]
MKTNNILRWSIGCVGLLVFIVASAAASIVSSVDTDLRDSQKYVLRVDGKPFYLTSIQVRLDKLRYYWNWDQTKREAIIARAAADGFNTISIPIHWYEVEPTKENFDWTILDEYLASAQKHGLKVELLWFGQNSDGHVQWLGNPSKNPVHLRTPDYVLHSPSPQSTATTSEYAIRRDMSAYTLDLADDRLRERETHVLGKVMAHVAEWDGSHGASHTVIGVQICNEVRGENGLPFPVSLIISYLSDLAGAVKTSPYVVWTRVNCISLEALSRIEENETLRRTTGTNLDFIGTDLYGVNAATIRAELPYRGKNYRMIMESGADVSNAAQFQLAALSGNNAFSYYDLCGPDGHGLYVDDGENGFKPNGSYIEDVRTVNKLLDSDIVDIAVNAHGYGLFVHNWSGASVAPTEGIEGIRFTPGYPTSQAISIRRSGAEIVLMNTRGGTFSLPAEMSVQAASRGHFDRENAWVEEAQVPIRGHSIFAERGTTIRLLRAENTSPYPIHRQAEFGLLGGGAATEAASDNLGFAGNGYVVFPRGGGYVVWTEVDGLDGGERSLRFRYANGDAKTRHACVFVNGAVLRIFFAPTGSWSSYQYVTLKAALQPGKTNTVRLETNGDGAGNIDELQSF